MLGRRSAEAPKRRSAEAPKRRSAHVPETLIFCHDYRPELGHSRVVIAFLLLHSREREIDILQMGVIGIP